MMLGFPGKAMGDAARRYAVAGSGRSPGASRPLRGRRGERLADRRGERAALDRLADAVRAGESRVLVVHGEPGVGKTALLDYLVGRAVGCGGGTGPDRGELPPAAGRPATCYPAAAAAGGGGPVR